MLVLPNVIQVWTNKPLTSYTIAMVLKIFTVCAFFLTANVAYGEAIAPQNEAPIASETPIVQQRFAAIQDCETCPKLVVIPPGEFVMGKDGPHKNEAPAHLVTIAKAFAVGMYEVTFDEWKACVAEQACGTKMPNDHDWGRGKRPVINITWTEATMYVAWLSKKTGHVYRLPSEAEWEYAARAGTITDFWWGDDIGVSKANCRNCGPEISHQSLPVNSFEPNPWGLYNVHGNVWEWTADCWNKTQDGAPSDGSARLTGDCRQKVMRGGSWYYFSKNLRSPWRFKNDGRVKSYGIGLRVLRELP